VKTKTFASLVSAAVLLHAGHAASQTEAPRPAAASTPVVKASAQSTWAGTWKEGRGTISTESATVRAAPFSFASRFEGAPGASPEELLAAALVGCFNQALVNNFGMNKLEAQSVSSSAEVTFGYDENNRPAIKGLHVTTEARVPNATDEVFQHSAKRASTNCTVARALKLEVSFVAKLLR
jgi:lipoyl-dependent peroxiredoxin